jgi:hypothetical protein
MNSDPSQIRVRRIVTGHDDAAKAVIAADEQLAGNPLAEDAGHTSAASSTSGPLTRCRSI